MRQVAQPGPRAARRVVTATGPLWHQALTLPAGATLLDAVTAPLLEVGLEAGVVELTGGSLAPFRYVRPAASDGPAHAAWYSAPFSPEGETRLERASITVGRRDGAPFLHCHAVWVEPDGVRRGGHILCDETTLATPVRAEAWAARGAAITARPDPETGFTLFAPEPDTSPAAPGRPLLLARIRPNEELHHAVEALCREHGLVHATLRGLGSLIGIAFEDGRSVPGPPTELLLTDATIAPGPDGQPRARIRVAAADEDGVVHEGWLARGEAVVLITMELALLG